MNNNIQNNDSLIISLRQAQLFVAFVLVSAFACFALGYFFGQKSAICSLVETTSTNVISDEIRTRLYTSTTIAQHANQEALNSQENVEHENIAIHNRQNIQSESNTITDATALSLTIIPQEELLVEKYYAPLIGYGTRQAAEQFLSRWPQAPLEIKTKKSRNTKGKEVTWYQITTCPFENKQELGKLISTIRKKERIQEKDIKIIPCKS